MEMFKQMMRIYNQALSVTMNRKQRVVYVINALDAMYLSGKTLYDIKKAKGRQAKWDTYKHACVVSIGLATFYALLIHVLRDRNQGGEIDEGDKGSAH